MSLIAYVNLSLNTGQNIACQVVFISFRTKLFTYCYKQMPPRIRFNQFINNCKFKFILKIYLLVIAFYIYICLIFTKNLQINGVCFIEPYFLDVKCQYLLSSLLFEPTNQWVSPKSGMITFG